MRLTAAVFFASTLLCTAQQATISLDGGADIAFSESRKLLYVSIPNQDRIAILDPATASIKDYISVKGGPTRLSATADGQYLYIALTNSIAGIATASNSIDQQFPLADKTAIRTIAAVPGLPTSILVLTATSLALYDGGVLRGKPLSTADATDIALKPDGSTAWLLHAGRTDVLRITSSGLQTVPSDPATIIFAAGPIAYGDGKLFPSDSSVRDAETGRNLGTLRTPGTYFAEQITAYESENQVIALQSFGLLAEYDTTRFISTASIATNFGRRFVRYSADWLAVLSDKAVALFNLATARRSISCFGPPARDPVGALHLPMLLGTSDVVYLPNSGRLYAATSGVTCLEANSVVPIDSRTLQPGKAIFAGSEPASLSASASETYLYAGLWGSDSVVRINVQKAAIEQTIPMPLQGSDYRTVLVRSFSPDPLSFAASFPLGSLWRVAVFDGATARRDSYDSVNSGPFATSSDGTSILQLTGNAVVRLPITATGVSSPEPLIPAVPVSNNIDVTARVLAAGNALFNESDGKPIAQFNSTTVITPDPANQRAFAFIENSLVVYSGPAWTRSAISPKLPLTSGGPYKILVLDKDRVLLQCNQELVLVPLSILQPAADTLPRTGAALSPTLRRFDGPVRSIAYQPLTKRLLATVGPDAGPSGNSLIAIDPATAAVEWLSFAGSEPQPVAVSPAGEYAFVYSAGDHTIRRSKAASTIPDLLIPVDASIGLAAMPGHPESIAAVGLYGQITIVDGAVPRPDRAQAQPYLSSLAFDLSGDHLYLSPSSQVSVVTPQGLQVPQSLPGLLSTQFVESGNLLLSSGQNGRIFDRATLELKGSLDWGAKGYSSSQNRIYVAFGPNLYMYDATTYVRLGQFVLPDTFLSITRIVECEPGTLALLDLTGRIWFLDTSAFQLTQPSDGIPSPQTTNGITIIPVPANDVVYHPQTQRLYTSMPLAAGAAANTLIAIDPATAQMSGTLTPGSVPNALKASPDGALYAGIDGSASLARISDQSTQTIPLSNPADGLLFIDRLAISPDGQSIAASVLTLPAAGNNGYSVVAKGWRTFGPQSFQQPADSPARKGPEKQFPIPVPPPPPPPIYVTYGDDPQTFYSYELYNGTYHIVEIGPLGKRTITSTTYPGNLVWSAGKLYTGSGFTIDASTGDTAFSPYFQQLPAGTVSLVAIDQGHAYYVHPTSASGPSSGLWLTDVDLTSGASTAKRLSQSVQSPSGIALYPGGIAVSTSAAIFLIPR